MSAIKPLTDLVRLWEVSHPYYAEEGNYHKAGMHEHYETWDDFVAKQYGMDLDLNLIYRWDWKIPNPEDYTEGEDMPPERLYCYFMGQRKANCWSTSVDVTREDEPEIRAWLSIRAQKIRDIWEPLLGGSA